MHFAILSFGAGWHVRDLMRAAAEQGHSAEVIDFRRVWAGVGQAASPAERTESGTLSHADAVLVRTMPPGSLEQVVFRMDVLHRFQAEGKRVLNPPAALEACIDKYLTTARLAAAGLPVPPTAVYQDAEAALEGFQSLGGDVVVKPLFGSEGRGMLRITDADLAWRTFRALERTGAVLYLQQFVHHPGWDLRGFVLGDRVIAGMRRYARDGWRTNVAQGGRAEAVALTVEEEKLALAAARAVGAPVAGVDLLPRPEGGWYVLEVNAVPGWRALGPVTGVDVGAAIVAYAGSHT
ncbi:MAG: RimK family alpha-L-glutamate ligase [Gemmataceae bacterium]